MLFHCIICSLQVSLLITVMAVYHQFQPIYKTIHLLQAGTPRIEALSQTQNHYKQWDPSSPQSELQLPMSDTLKHSHPIKLDVPPAQLLFQRVNFVSLAVTWWTFYPNKPHRGLRQHPAENSWVGIIVSRQILFIGGWKTRPFLKFGTGRRLSRRTGNGFISGIWFDQSSSLQSELFSRTIMSIKNIVLIMCHFCSLVNFCNALYNQLPCT